MFNLGWGEMLVIAAAGFLLFGPNKLPQLAKSLGEAIRIFRREMKSDDTK